MRWNYKLKGWHNWFAWHPIQQQDGKGWLWLEVVQRKKCYLFEKPGNYSWYIYRTNKGE